MKRYFLILFFVVISLLGGCGKDETFVALNNSLAEKRISLAYGECDGVKATIMTGYREEDYVINGVASNLIEFFVLTFYVDGFDAYDYGVATFVLNIGMDRFTGELELNPYDNSLVVDIGKIYDISENVMAKLNLLGKTYKIYFKPISSTWAISADMAIEIYYTTFKNELKNFVVKDKLNGEVYVKILQEDIGKQYYWYISFVSTDGKSVSALIDIDTGDIVTSSVNI